MRHRSARRSLVSRFLRARPARVVGQHRSAAAGRPGFAVTAGVLAVVLAAGLTVRGATVPVEGGQGRTRPEPERTVASQQGSASDVGPEKSGRERSGTPRKPARRAGGAPASPTPTRDTRSGGAGSEPPSETGPGEVRPSAEPTTEAAPPTSQEPSPSPNGPPDDEPSKEPSLIPTLP